MFFISQKLMKVSSRCVANVQTRNSRTYSCVHCTLYRGEMAVFVNLDNLSIIFYS